MPEICLSVFAVVTAYADLTNDKIYNQMTVITMITGLTFSALEGGRTGMLQALLSVLGAFLLLFPVYFLLHGVGAGDIKLWMALATFFPFDQMLRILVVSFVIAAGIGIVILWRSRGQKGRHTLHFAVPVMLAVLLSIGGIY